MSRKKSMANLQYIHIKIEAEDKRKLELLARQKGFYTISDFVRVTMMQLVRDESSKGDDKI